MGGFIWGLRAIWAIKGYTLVSSYKKLACLIESGRVRRFGGNKGIWGIRIVIIWVGSTDNLEEVFICRLVSGELRELRELEVLITW